MDVEKMANLFKLSPVNRYKYFISKAADLEALWGLYDQGWAMMADDSGRQMVPLWAEEEFAKTWTNDAWPNYRPEKLDVQSFLRKWIAGMRKDGVLAAIFPLPSGTGIPVEPEELGRALIAELRYLCLRPGLAEQRQQHLMDLLRSLPAWLL